MVCTNCGAQNLDTVALCQHCGRPMQTRQEPQTHSSSPPSPLTGAATKEQKNRGYAIVIVGAVVALIAYYTITLNEMFLQDNQKWWQEWFPAIQFQLKASFNETDITLTTVNQPPLGQSNHAVDLDHVIVDLMPYGGETIEITLALTALQGQN